jgi:hypothetical protein
VYANPINRSSEKASVIVVVERLEELRREWLKYGLTILNLAVCQDFFLCKAGVCTVSRHGRVPLWAGTPTDQLLTAGRSESGNDLNGLAIRTN